MLLPEQLRDGVGLSGNHRTSMPTNAANEITGGKQSRSAILIPNHWVVVWW